METKPMPKDGYLAELEPAQRELVTRLVTKQMNAMGPEGIKNFEDLGSRIGDEVGQTRMVQDDLKEKLAKRILEDPSMLANCQRADGQQREGSYVEDLFKVLSR